MNTIGIGLLTLFISHRCAAQDLEELYNARQYFEIREALSHTIRSGGAGGITETPGYKMKDVELTVGGKTARFKEIEVISEKTSERSRVFYGNLGQDLIKQYDKMTIDFRAMRLTFE